LGFAPFSTPAKGVLFVFCDESLKFGPATRRVLGDATDVVERATAAERFKGKNGSVLDIVAPAGLEVGRLVIIGCGKVNELKSQDFLKLGGLAMGKVRAAVGDATVIAELSSGVMDAEQVADLAQGVRLRAYTFDRYKTKYKEGEEKRA